jgi:hypothetical protein
MAVTSFLSVYHKPDKKESVTATYSPCGFPRGQYHLAAHRNRIALEPRCRRLPASGAYAKELHLANFAVITPHFPKTKEFLQTVPSMSVPVAY